MMRFTSFSLVVLIVGFFFGACESPTTFERDNPSDPGSSVFNPKPPTDLSIALSDETIALSWTDNSQREDGYLIERAVDAGPFAEVVRLASNTTSFSEPVNFLGFVVSYRVSSFLLQGSVLTKLDGQEQSLELSNFSERFALPRFINERQMRIEWEDPFTFETGFELERRIGDGTFELVATVPADTVSYVDRFDFIDREIYWYRIRAVHNAARSPYSRESGPQLKVDPPGFLAHTHLSDQSLALAWTEPRLAAGFVIERSTEAEGIFAEIGRVQGNVTTYQDDTLDPAQTYSYRVRTLASSPSDELRFVFREVWKAAQTLSTPANALALSPDSRLLAAAWGSGATLWDMASATRLAVLVGGNGFVEAVSFSPDGQRLATGDIGRVQFWDVASATVVQTITGHSATVQAVAFNPDGQWVLTGSEDGTFARWNLDSGDLEWMRSERTTEIFDESFYNVKAVAVSPDGATVATAGYTGIKLWDAATGTFMRRLPTPQGTLYAVTFSADGRWLAWSGRNTVIFEVGTGLVVRSIPPEDANAITRDLAFNPEGTLLATASRKARLWRVDTGAWVQTLEAPHSNVAGVAFSADGQTLVTGGSLDGTILWKQDSAEWIVLEQ